MICPRCNGKGRITQSVEAKRAADSFVFVPCDYPGCVGGTVQCCEGDQEQPTKADDNAAVVGDYNVGNPFYRQWGVIHHVRPPPIGGDAAISREVVAEKDRAQPIEGRLIGVAPPKFQGY